jgi:hypothetical protein
VQRIYMRTANATLFALSGDAHMRTTIKFLEMAIGGMLLLGLGAYIVQGFAMMANAVL